MKKLLPLMIFSSFAFVSHLQATTLPSVDNMEDFHPEITAGQVPTPEVQTTQNNPETLAVIPFEEENSATAPKGKIEEIEIYPMEQIQKRRKTSEPDNPVNNVIASHGGAGIVTQAPILKIAPPKQMPESLFGRP